MVPPLLRATVDEFRILFREAPAYWREQALPSYLAAIEQWKAVDPASGPDERLLAGVRELALADAPLLVRLLRGASRREDNGRTAGPLSDDGGARARSDQRDVPRGFPSPTVDAETELEALAERIRASDELRALVAATPTAGLPEAIGSTREGQDWLTAFSLSRPVRPPDLQPGLRRAHAGRRPPAGPAEPQGDGK